jgi:predicted nucleic acid-binding protein
VSLYLDASVLVALVVPDARADRARLLVSGTADLLIVSDFASAEFASAISRQVRTRLFTRDQGQVALDKFDSWASAMRRIELTAGDVATAELYIRRLDLVLLAPDAIHIAMSHRAGATLVTFDRAMVIAARALGVAVAEA